MRSFGKKLINANIGLQRHFGFGKSSALRGLLICRTLLSSDMTLGYCDWRNFWILDFGKYCTNICHQIFVILEVHFHQEGGLSKGRYFELFYTTGSLYSMQNFIFYWGLFFLFVSFFLIIDKFCLLNWFFICKIWVIASPNKHFLGVWDSKWMRNKLLLLYFFSTFLNPQRDTLTHSVVVSTRLFQCLRKCQAVPVRSLPFPR